MQFLTLTLICQYQSRLDQRNLLGADKYLPELFIFLKFLEILIMINLTLRKMVLEKNRSNYRGREEERI
jgi:hypothetical protein